MDSSTPETPLDCSEVVRSLWEYLDQRATSDFVEAIDHHLALCEGCRAHFAFEERLIETISGMRKEHSDPERLREEVLKVLRAAGLGERGRTCRATAHADPERAADTSHRDAGPGGVRRAPIITDNQGGRDVDVDPA